MPKEQQHQLDPDLKRLHEAIESATTGMTDEQLVFHPEGKWNTVQVLEHLYLTYRGTASGMEKCLQEGKPLARKPNLRDRLKTMVVVNLRHFPNGRKAPERSVPRGMPMEDILKGIGPELIRMDDAIAQVEIRFGKRRAVLDHPVLGPLTPSQWRKFHCVHGQHHLKQIQKLREGSTGVTQ
jgi:Protein of unknown function (DUF1569)